MKTQVQAGSAAATVGIQETPDRINRKVNRCKFSAAFFLACMKALETEVIDLRTGSK
jgi:hypothetical protein